MKNDERFAKLDSLSNWELVHDDQDIRGWPVSSRTGDAYGTIDDMLVDKDNERVLAVRLTDGRLVAVDHLEIRDSDVIYHDDAAASTVDYRQVRRRQTT